jgi:ABC-type lipoprotein release transport system permease subunit
MKNKDIMLLSIKNIKEDKKKNKHTIIALSFSLTILVVVLFLGIGFKYSVRNTIQKYDAISTAKIHSKNYDLNDLNPYQTNHKYINKVISDINSSIENTISYDSYDLSTISFGGFWGRPSDQKSYNPKIKIDNNPVDYNKPEQIDDEIQAFYDKMMFDFEKDFMNKTYNSNPLIKGQFSEQENEIVLSKKFVDNLNLDYKSLIGKTISYYLPVKNSDTKEIYDLNVFSNLKIVGIYDDRLFNSPSRNELSFFAPTFLINKKTIVNLPKQTDSLSYTIVKFKTFEQTESFENKRSDIMDKYSDSTCTLSSSTNTILQHIEYSKPLFNFLTDTFVIFSIVVLISTIINLYITLSYSYMKNKKYMAMCKALGMKKKDTNKLFFFNTYLVFAISLIFVITISLITSILLSLLLNNTLLHSFVEGVGVTINLIYYLPVLFATILLIFLITYVLSVLIRLKDRKESITNLLKTE